MEYIDVTYKTARIDYERGEASMRLLISEDIARWLVEGGLIVENYRARLEEIAAYRERLCHGRHVDGSASGRIVDDGEEGWAKA